MLSLRHTVSQRLSAALGSPVQYLAVRRNHGDPGPQTSAHRKSQRSRLRDVAIGQSGSARRRSEIDGDTFRAILSAEPPLVEERRPKREYQPRERRPREPVIPGRDGGMRRDRPARAWDAETNKWKFLGGEGGGRLGAQAGQHSSEAFDRGSRGHGGRDYVPRDTSSSSAFTPGIRGDRSDSPFSRRSSPASRPPYPERGATAGSSSGTRSKDDPFTTSALLRDHIKACQTPMSNQQVDAAMRIVETAPRASVNAVVWNQLLAMLGREGRMEKMWKVYNDMKKSGIKPTAHTYTSLLNSYAGLAHSAVPFHTTSQSHAVPPPNHLSRVSIIWKQAQTHLSTLSSAPSGLSVPEAPAETTDGNLFGPINAYLKFLAKYRMWEEMWSVYTDAVAKEEKWDRVGYTTMFQALPSLARKQVADARNGADKRGQIMVGPLARELWDDAIKSLAGKNVDEGGLDSHLAGMGVSALLMGRPEDQRFALSLIPELWGLAGLPSETPSTIPVSETPAIRLPNLKIDVRSATTLLHSLITASRPTLASHYATLLLSRPRIRKEADPPLLYACATAFAETGDIIAILDLLQKHAHRPPQAGWKIGFWHDCLTAARWARVDGAGGLKGDWEGIKAVLGWMGVVPKAQAPVADEWKRKPAAHRPDIIKPVRLDAKAMAIILKTALGRTKAQVMEAVGVLDRAGLGYILREFEGETNAVRAWEEVRGKDGNRWEWTKELSKEMVRALEGLGERDALAVCESGTIEVIERLYTREKRRERSSPHGGVDRGGSRDVQENPRPVYRQA